MTKKILVIGGAGFIGSHLIDELLKQNHEIVVYDNLDPQVHGNISKPPNYLAKDVDFILADVLDKKKLTKTIEDIDVIYHLAAKVGVGQSMYQIDDYVDVNTLGTARLLNILVNEPNDVEKLIIASSMATYGEGGYICEKCGKVNPELRGIKQLKDVIWELNCPNCQKRVNPIPTDEKKPQNCTSIYALTKKEQEKMCLLIGKTYNKYNCP